MATQQYNVLPGAYHAHSVCVRVCVEGRIGGRVAPLQIHGPYELY